MGVRRSNFGGGRGSKGVIKQRESMSFMLVVIFFAIFGLIVLSEIFLIDEKRGSNMGNTGTFGGHRSGHRLTAVADHPDYEELKVRSLRKLMKTISKTLNFT